MKRSNDPSTARCSITGARATPSSPRTPRPDGRQLEVELQRPALPVATEGIAQHELELRPVEGALPRVHGVGEPGALDGAAQPLLGPVPGFVAAEALLGRSENLTAISVNPKSA